ncbi:MAG TPA: bifunctional oligoribonuclease/PAP phosphatase NrnA [Patescibacteria group bacterium]|nr:bifunctional oligoribonuclease/PAP phosphatase NrnA [Patescibacteria group bacterium]
MDSPRNILRAIKSAKSILVPLHLRPDGDSVGSALGCYHFLRGIGKKVVLVSADPIPESFGFITGVKRVRIGDPSQIDLSRFDLLLFLDHAEAGRLSRREDFSLPSQMIVVNIDHHITNPNFGDLNYVDPASPSTAEILFDLLRRWKAKITPTIADCLLTGIYTDTGGFLYSSTIPSTFTKTSQLIRLGADREKIVENSFRSWPPKTLAIWSLILTNSRRSGRLLYSYLPLKEIQRLKIKLDELSPARSFATNNLLLAMKGIKVAAMFTEEKPRLIRVSLRSKAGFNIANIAKDMGGGGHVNAAAFDHRRPLKETISKTVKLLQRVVA